MDTCDCNSKATINTVHGVEKLHSSTCSKETEWKWPKKEEPKQECDHIVRFTCFDQEGSIDLSSGKTLEVYDESGNLIEYKCKLCPECGEKLNLKKDE